MNIRILTFALVAAIGFSQAAAGFVIPVAYLRQEVEQPPVLSNLDPVPPDLGPAGAALALADNATTGRFLGQEWQLELISVPPGGDFAAAAEQALAQAALILVEAAPAQITALADLAPEALILNVGSGDAGLRGPECRANLLHTLPEDSARSDALMQWLAARRWRDTVMIVGPHPVDAEFAAALRRSANKFGVRILAERTWTFDTDLRESTMQEVPRFTQDLPEHDVLIVADETDDFGRYVEHNAWLPRPVAGSDGLRPLAWSTVIESWGAVQLQNRFEERAGRPMLSRDYAAWLALRALGEAVTRTSSTDPATLRSYMLGESFALDGFKGRALSFRHWNGQMRQPIPLANARALVTQAPLEGFLHHRNDLDTLGLDEAESTCTAFGD